MELDPEEIKRAIQWFHAVEDLNNAYLEPEDRSLAARLKEAFALEAPALTSQAPAAIKNKANQRA